MRRKKSYVAELITYRSSAEIRHSQTLLACARSANDRDRGTPRGATPPTPPGIRVTYHGGSTGLGLGRDMESGETE